MQNIEGLKSVSATLNYSSIDELILKGTNIHKTHISIQRKIERMERGGRIKRAEVYESLQASEVYISEYTKMLWEFIYACLKEEASLKKEAKMREKKDKGSTDFSQRMKSLDRLEKSIDAVKTRIEEIYFGSGTKRGPSLTVIQGGRSKSTDRGDHRQREKTDKCPVEAP